MSIMIREYLGYDKFDVEYNYNEAKHLTEGLTVEDPVSSDSLMVDIEGIHVGPTRNFTRYMGSALKSSQRSWTKPYEKPLIMHHNEKDGKIIGRIKSVYYTDVNTRSGTGALVFTANVPDKEGMEQVQDGRLMTVSIGIIGHDVRCSVCQHNIAEHGACEHERGQVYDGEVCYWDIHAMEGKELSYVIVPSDVYAKNIKIYKPNSKKTQLTEQVNTKRGVSTMELTEAQIQQIQDDLKAATEEKTKLEADLKEAEDKKAELETELKETKEELVTAQAASKEDVELGAVEAEKSELEKKLGEAQDKLKEAQDKLTDLQSELSEEKELRESLESAKIETASATKQALVENLALLRKLAGKPEIATETIAERTQESIVDAIIDLKEEMSGEVSPTTISTVDNPTITESIEPKGNKGNNDSNIDLEQGFESLLNGLVGKFNNK